MKFVNGSWLFLTAIVLAGVSSGNERKVYPNRWVRISSNLRDDSDVERIRAIVKTASEHGLNGIAFSAGLDSQDLARHCRVQAGQGIRKARKLRQITARVGPRQPGGPGPSLPVLPANLLDQIRKHGRLGPVRLRQLPARGSGG